MQVFDRASTETIFGDMYADLCFRLSSALPSFEVPSQDANKRPCSTFRSALHPSPDLQHLHCFQTSVLTPLCRWSRPVHA